MRRHLKCYGVLILVTLLIILVSPYSFSLAEGAKLCTEDGRALPTAQRPEELVSYHTEPELLRDTQPERLLVKRQDDVLPATFQAVLKRAGFGKALALWLPQWWRVDVPPQMLSAAATHRLLALDEVTEVRENRQWPLLQAMPRQREKATSEVTDVMGRALLFHPNDEYLSYQWHLLNVDARQAWDITLGSPDVRIVIVDSGIDYAHPDRPKHLLLGYDYGDNDDNPRDWAWSSADGDYAPAMGHGTHIAGIVAARTNNSIGVAGVCPDCEVYVIKVSDSAGWITTDAFVDGIIEATTNSILAGKRTIINLSIGTPMDDPVIRDAIEFAQSEGALIVAAAGNEGPGGLPVFPARLPGVLSISATNEYDEPCAFSQWALIGAPGNMILSTVPLALPEIAYQYWSSTSMAAPVVAGAAGLVWTVHPEWTADQVAQRLLDTAGRRSDWDDRYGAGRVNVYDALLDPTPGVTPTATCTSIPMATSTLAITITATPDPGPTVPSGPIGLPLIWCSRPAPTPTPTATPTIMGPYPQPSLPPEPTATLSCEALIDSLDGVGKLYSYDGGMYLGLVSSDEQVVDSIINHLGVYGSSTSPTSISNRDGPFGSASSDRSAYNPQAACPPILWRWAETRYELVAFVTVNSEREPSINPDRLLEYLRSKAH